MNAPRHEMILASAGSGKTYALTNRFVQLLALGAKPERIIALTFTRKAAGEFFDEILNKLARAASEPAFAEQLARDTEIPPLHPEQFCGLLRSVIEAMPRLTLGTFDSFFARIVRTFPLELGLTGDFELLEEHAANRERQRVLRRLFTASGRTADDARRDFAEAFKRATFGIEEKRLATLLDRFIDEHLRIFLAAPDGAAWGNVAQIWPDGSPWVGADDVGPAADALGTLLRPRTDLPDNARARLELFLATIKEWTAGSPLPDAADRPLINAFDVWPDLRRGAATWTIERRKLALGPAECAALLRLLHAIGGAEVARRLEVTQGIHAVLAGYDAVYHELVRRSGRLTFADVLRLLSGVEIANHATPPTMSTTAERRLIVDWRLDGKFDHWLLDEFQDTSPAQWDVLRNLIDEVVQDTSLQRTFFYVGDVKQAIYGWREGDARLFREIFNYYNLAAQTTGTPAIHERRLDASHRSGPPILALVNRVFGNAAELARLFPAAAAQRWSDEWRDHTSAKPALTGHAAWLHAEDENARFDVTLKVLQEIQPTARGLTAAVLVRRNETANRLADHLRREGHLAAIAESDLHVCTDNPLTAALLALFKAAAHPGDTLAWHHVRLTPLRSVLEAENLATSDALAVHVLTYVHRHGFERTVEWWWSRVEPLLAPDDAFSRERGRQLAEAARRFDATGGRSVAEFLQFMERHVVRDTESADVIRVMTIHKAKGLGFDVVILPDLEGTRLAQRRDELAVHRAPDREVQWVLNLPPRMFYQRDEILAAHVAGEEADACYDQLALLYVGMTRAKRGLYLITKPVGSSQSENFPQLLGATLGDDVTELTLGANLRAPSPYSCGDVDWFKNVAKPSIHATAPEVPLAPLTTTPEQRRPRLPARSPSDVRTGTIAATALFAPQEFSAGEFGRAVHALFATIAWWDPAQAEAWIATQRESGADDDALAAVHACLEAPALAGVFRRRSDARDEVWRERAFEIVLEGTWVTGVFDRVIVRRDRSGAITQVEVFDFKTDRVGPDPQSWPETAARHAAQLHLYRLAAAVLAGVPVAQVRCAAVLTGAIDPTGRRPGPLELP